MKKIKLFLFAAMIIGAASAFKTAKPLDDIWVPGKTSSSSTLAQGLLDGGSCDPTHIEKCYYSDSDLQNPIEDSPDGRFVYPQ